MNLFASIVLSVIQAVWPQAPSAQTLLAAAFVCAVVGTLCTVIPCLKTKWIDDIRLDGEDYSSTEVSTFLSLVPVLITANMAFNALYNSMQFWYQQQACQMDLRMPFLGGGQLAGSFFMIADCIAIVVATPIAIGWLNPMLERSSAGRFGHMTKYGLGMAFGIASVALAAKLEMHRRTAPVLPMDSNCAPAGIQMSDMNAAWMIVPFFLMGIGEIYTMPVLMHFAYSRSPASMQTLMVAVNFIISAVSNSIFTVQIAALSQFVPNDLNKGHLELGYVSNIIIGVSFYAAYVYCGRQFPEKPSAP
jgi:dipeptide/tripeptide permease